MKLDDAGSQHLTYCLNVHPGTTLEEVRHAIQSHAAEVHAAVCPDHAFGLGLRLGARAAEELEAPGALEAFGAFLASERCYAFTLNGFPYGDFHGTRVKENVYAPDWQTDERLDYTLRLARCLAGLLPAGAEGSISTVPCSYKPWVTEPGQLEAIVRNLARCAVALAELETLSGKTLHLGLEPEPACLLETTKETVAFFNEHLFASGTEMVTRETGRRASEAEELLRRHLGVCVDTCHVALQFEDLSEVIETYAQQGIRISKVQLSAALRAAPTREALDALRPFDEPTYLHQVIARAADGSLSRWTDLPDALSDPSLERQEEARVHFHVPLFWSGDAKLVSTADQLTPDLFKRLAPHLVQHLEIETYTYDVLPPALRKERVSESIIEEFRWVWEQSSR